ncbi:MAG: PfkB family carbohydrate kinase [Gemmatimonadota bacterium]
MSGILVVGSVALDSVETPFGRVTDTLGGSAVFFSAAASLFTPIRLVGVVGEDYPLDALDFLVQRGVDLAGLECRSGRSFRWSAVYGYDLNSRETLSTELGVFADFQPTIPRGFRDARWIFLGNIHPGLQLEVLEQVQRPEFVACDTMNYWIEGERKALIELLGRIDMLLVNDAEARELSGSYSLAQAARWIHERGPTYVVIKKGEHGAILFSREGIFFAPGYPLEDVFDPTGAGDAFAGGLLGHVARAGSLHFEEMKRAIVYGCALGSFACEAFGPERFIDLTGEEVGERVQRFREMTRFEYPAPVGW